MPNKPAGSSIGSYGQQLGAPTAGIASNITNTYAAQGILPQQLGYAPQQQVTPLYSQPMNAPASEVKKEEHKQVKEKIVYRDKEIPTTLFPDETMTVSERSFDCSMNILQQDIWGMSETAEQVKALISDDYKINLKAVCNKRFFYKDFDIDRLMKLINSMTRRFIDKSLSKVKLPSALSNILTDIANCIFCDNVYIEDFINDSLELHEMCFHGTQELKNKMELMSMTMETLIRSIVVEKASNGYMYTYNFVAVFMLNTYSETSDEYEQIKKWNELEMPDSGPYTSIFEREMNSVGRLGYMPIILTKDDAIVIRHKNKIRRIKI